MQHAGRVIPLRLPLHGVPGQMGASQVHAEQRLPVAYILVGLEIHLPACTSVELGQDPLLVQLPGHGGNLLGHPVASVALAEDVDAGIVHVLIEAHEGTLHDGLAAQGILMEHMACEDQAVFPAPVLDGDGKALEEELLAQLEIIPGDLGHLTPASAQEQLRQVLLQAVAETLLEFREQIRRIGDGVRLPFREIREHAAPVWLVREDAQNLLSEPVTAFFSVFLMGQFDVFLYGLPVHGVHIAVTVVIVIAHGIAGTELYGRLPFLQGVPCPKQPLSGEDSAATARLPLFHGRLLFHFAGEHGHRILIRPPGPPGILRQTVHLQEHGPILLFLRHHAPGASRGPAVLIVEPGLHPRLMPIIRTFVGQLEPFLPQVLRLQSGAGVHEIAAEAHFLDDVYLAAQLRLLQPAVPGPEGLSPVLRCGIFK